MKSFYVAWFVFATITAIGLAQINWMNAYRLWKLGAQSTAEVTALDRANHNTVSYQFVANGRAINSSQQGYSAIARTRVHERVPVYYLPNTPSVSLLDTPGAVLENETITILLAATIFPMLALFGWRRLTRPRGEGVAFHGAPPNSG